MTVEIWLPVVDFEDFYSVSNLGRVKSNNRITETRNRWGAIKRTFQGKLLKAHMPKNNYPQVTLCVNGRHFQRTVHSIVANAFLGCKGKAIVCHKDDDRKNSQLSNLYHGNFSTNAHDAKRNGKAAVGENHHASRLKEAEVITIRALAGTATYAKISERFGVTKSCVGVIIRRVLWKNISELAVSERRRAMGDA